MAAHTQVRVCLCSRDKCDDDILERQDAVAVDNVAPRYLRTDLAHKSALHDKRGLRQHIVDGLRVGEAGVVCEASRAIHAPV